MPECDSILPDCRNSGRKYFIGILLLWAGIYLSGLGVLEVSFTESRRILPAIDMIRTGDWAVPVFEGKKYYRKPPMQNWLIGQSFLLSGVRNEFTARLPSAIGVLVFASLLVLMKSGWQTPRERFISALLYMTTFGIIGKGLVAEIESLYISMTGCAMLSWLDTYSLNRSARRLWIVPGIFLGICLLLKGPVCLFFFYAMVVAVLFREADMKRLLSVWHMSGLGVMLAIFCSWAVPVFAMEPASGGLGAGGTWKYEILLQLEKDKFEVSKWFKRAVGAFLNFLPWLFFLPLCFMTGRLLKDEKRAKIAKSCLIAVATTFILVNLMPGTKARYAMPLIPLWCIVVGTLVSSWSLESFRKQISVGLKIIFMIVGLVSMLCFGLMVFAKLFPASFPASNPHVAQVLYGILKTSFAGVAVFLVVGMASASVCFAILKRSEGEGIDTYFFLCGLLVMLCFLNFAALKPVLSEFQDSRACGAVVENSVPTGETLYAYKPGTEPFLFYIREPWTEIWNSADLDSSMRCLLVTEKSLPEIYDSLHIARKDIEIAGQFEWDQIDYYVMRVIKTGNTDKTSQ